MISINIDSDASGYETWARPVFLHVGRLCEQVCIAMLGYSDATGPWARATTSKPLTGLPNDLGQALTTFGNLVAADFQERCGRGQGPREWTPPISGLILGDWFIVDGFDVDDALRVATSMSAFAPRSSTSLDAENPASITGPRTSEESRFFEAVKLEVLRTRPKLASGFRRGLSLTGKAAGGEIDFVGNHYVTCYAAINPRGRAATRVQTAAAALWRLARTRDAFGFAAPAAIELTAWVPPTGLPIYTDQDYRIASETVAELREQASKEELTIFTVPDAPTACRRLVAIEVDQATALS